MNIPTVSEILQRLSINAFLFIFVTKFTVLINYYDRFASNSGKTQEIITIIGEVCGTENLIRTWVQNINLT